MRVALDQDSTLADTMSTAFNLMLGPDHDYSPEDSDSWEWGEEEFGQFRFLSALWHAWSIRPLHIEPMETGLEETTARLAEHHTVDVVTAHPDHPGISEGKQHWLSYNGIQYEEFVPVTNGESKAELDYDIYIDDKPALPPKVTDATVYLIDASHNQDAEGEYIRVANVEEAVDHITKTGITSSSR